MSQIASDSFAVGSLVAARGREWVVLPDSDDDVLVLRPLGGTEEEVTGIVRGLEPVEPAAFEYPNPSRAGDANQARLLRDALRLGFRSSAGPFRSFGRIAVEPRPYQLVPLLMALKLDPVRLLIADDVGIGKTVEAALVARELLDQGDARRLAVLCPPHLAEQWQAELAEKFHIDAELVLAGTAARLERGLGLGESIFDVYPHVVVSTDYIKADRRRTDFVRACPEVVIVDEAHTFAFAAADRGRHQRHQLLTALAADASRHLVLVTATPHSGKEETFRSLLGFLDPELERLPEDLTAHERERERRRLARHMVQRRRADIRAYLDTLTPFPDRESREETYRLSSDYRALFARVLELARETVLDSDTDARRQRVRWWSALGLLRALGSSPAAVAATLRSRAAPAEARSVAEADAVGARTVLDAHADEGEEILDVDPGSDLGGDDDEDERHRRRLRELARTAEALAGGGDGKLTTALTLVRELIDDSFQPIVFCRFIATAEYVAEALRKKLGAGAEVAAVTGRLVPAEREERVAELARAERRVLVATDCLSEGVNLQGSFDAVFHYDLSWNPTRHEQREGRVDRFGQQSSTVRVLTYYGIDNQIDGIVLDVLLRKHKQIRDSLGISVPIPGDTNAVMEAVLESLLARGRDDAFAYDQLNLIEEVAPERGTLHGEWDQSAEREKRSRTLFAQQTIAVDEVARELEAAREAVGSGVDARRFTIAALRAHGATVRERGGAIEADLREAPLPVREAVGVEHLRARFEPVGLGRGELYLDRTHPVVEGLAAHVLDSALDTSADGAATRCGAIRTLAVDRRTTALLMRFRFGMSSPRGSDRRELLAEDARVLAFAGAPESPEWLDPEAAEALLEASPDANLGEGQAERAVARMLTGLDPLREALTEAAWARAEEIAAAHGRVRAEARAGSARYEVRPKLPPDVLGLYVFLPLAETPH